MKLSLIGAALVASVSIAIVAAWWLCGVYGAASLACWIILSLAATLIWTGFHAAADDHDDPDYGAAS